jgi:hypothetical protein
MKIKKDECDIKAHLLEQIKFLKNSIILFDKGDYEECKRIAVSIRVLVHDSKNSISLLKQLKKKDISFYDNASSYLPGNLFPTARLVALASTKEGEATYIPNKDLRYCQELCMKKNKFFLNEFRDACLTVATP